MDKYPGLSGGRRYFHHIRALLPLFAMLGVLLAGSHVALAQTGAPPVVTLVGANPQLILQGGSYTELGATASDPEDGNITGSIVITGVGAINLNVPGDYTVTYTVTDAGLNIVFATRTVTVTPNTPPVVTLVGANPQLILQGGSYTELGATATDAQDGNITGSIIITGVGTINVNVPGNYTVTYTVTDSNSNTVAVNRTVTVTPNTPPVVTLVGANPQLILQGGSYTELGATATDAQDGNITGSIIITGVGTINVNVPGNYTVTYTVTDSNSNTVAVNRTVTVTPNTPPVVTLVGANPQLILQGGSYTELGATATDAQDGNITGSIIITGVGTINVNVPGNYTVTYTVTDSNSNTVAVNRTVTVTPNTPPVVTLVGANPQLILQGGSYTELGATATDAQDGNITANIVITGVGTINVNVPGNYTVTYTVTDSNSNTVAVNRTVTVTPNTPPVVTLVGANPQLILQGGSYTELGATATDAQDGNITANIVITGVGTINVNVPGNYTVTYTVTDSNSNTVAVNRTVTVTPNTPPVVTLVGANPQLILQGGSYTELGATASDAQDGNITANIVITGVGTINVNVPGNYTVTYTVTDSNSNTVAVNRTVTVTPNTPPTFTSSAPTSATEEVLYTYTMTATDANGHALTFAAPTLPSWLSFNGSNTISGTPQQANVGPHNVIVTVSDGIAPPVQQSFTITVSNVNDLPTAVAEGYTTAEDTTLNVAAPGVLGNDTDPDPGTTLTAILNSTTANGTLTLNANGSFSYVPSANFNGADSFTYRASDGSLSSNVVTVSITVTAGNDAPIAVADSHTTAEDTTLNVPAPGVLGNDTDPDAGTTLTAVLNTTSSNGTLTLNANGSFSYVPNANFSGADSFTYRANDGSVSSNVVTVSITVTAGNDAPTAVADSHTTAEDTTLNVPAPGVLGNDTDPDAGTTLTAVLSTTASNGTLTLNANGSFSYVPNANFNGADSFTYGASDGTASSNIVTVSITVTAGNDAPVAVADSHTTAEDTTLNVAAPGVLGNDTDPDSGTALTAVLDTNVTRGTLTFNANGSFSYVPNANFSGADSFTYHASDGTVSSNVVTVTVTVTGANDAPTAVADSHSTAEDTTLNVAAPGVLGNDTDPDTGTTLTAVLDTNVASGTLTLNPNGSFSYVPNANFNGADSFTYHANDGTVSSNVVTVSITVTAGNDAPVAVADSYTTVEDTPLSVAAPGVLANDTDPDTATTLTAVLDVTTLNGALALNANGSFSYVPNPNFSGADSFTYHANDGTVAGNVVAVTITVTGVNDPPFVTSPPILTVAEDVTYSYTITATDPEGNALTFAAPTLPSWLVFTAPATISGTPTQNQIGTHNVIMTVSDGIAAPVQQSFTVTVTSVDDAPVIATSIPDQIATELVAFNLNLGTFVSDVDTPSSSLVYSATTALPAGLTLSAAGILSGIPTFATSVGDFVVGFAVSDGPGRAVPPTATFKLTVLRAGRADLAVTVAATPNPVALNTAATWTFTITNNAPTVNVGGVSLQAIFAGDVPFQFSTPTNGCTISPAGSQTQASCTLGPLAGGATTTVTLVGTGNFAGDVFATATVSIAGTVPIDETPRNDTATGSLSVAQSVSTAPAQGIAGFDARAAAAGDLNGDGFIDLAIATGPTQSTMVLLNVVDPANPNKRVLSSTPIALGGQASDNGIVLVDLDGDSDLDIVTATGAGTENRVFLNSGSATFTALAVGDASEASRAVAAGDINGDLRTDLVFANGSPSTVYMNQGSAGVFARTAALGNADSRGVVLVDLFGDALPELVLANADSNAAVYRNTGGVFQLELALPTGPTTSVAAADFNNDRRVDLVFGRGVGATATAIPSNLVWLNTSGATGSFFLTDELGASATRAVAVADTDLDGDADILAINDAGAHQIYLNVTGAAFALHPQQIGSRGALAAALGRLSVDARVDAALVGPDGVAVFYNDGSGNLGGGDTAAPIIQLLGEPAVTLTVESAYADAGATATDAVDGNVTARIVVNNPVNPAVIGSYTVTYDATDSSGNRATRVTRTVQVQARQGAGGGGGGAAGLELILFLAFVTVVGRLNPKWRQRSSAS